MMKFDKSLQQFKFDLKTLSAYEVVQKHITSGSPVVLSSDEYYDLRSIIAKHFDLHLSEVVLVGSCRTGFSIAPKKLYQFAGNGSDLDVALVSKDRFDDYWDRVFEYANRNPSWKCTRAHRSFRRMLFNGWIDPRGLPNVAQFKAANDWVRFFDSLMQSRMFGRRRVSARLYRSWSRLEAYQLRSVVKCLVELREENE